MLKFLEQQDLVVKLVEGLNCGNKISMETL
jgi:hypothetical protein